MTTDKSPPGNGDGGAGDNNDLEMMQVTHDHLLKEAVRITQPVDGYRVGTDAVLLAASVSTDNGRILDMGAGVGGVALCIAHRLAGVQITAVEKDTDIAELADINITDNGFSSRIRLIKGDVTTMPAVLAASFDHVVSNPPYHDVRGTRPRNRARALAHMGEDTSLEDWVKAAIWAAKPRARISFICRADRAAELITLFETHGAGETLIFPLWPRHASPAGRVIIQVRRGVEGPGAILPGLVMHNDKGGFTEMASRIMVGDALFVIHPARPQVAPN
jgi:tRNA1Val (adenine37-N6)-methyltransferase